MSYNVALTGRLGGDPELRFTPQGKAVASFSMVTSKPVKQDNGSWEDTETTWHRVTVWDQQGENVAESLRKGDEVIVIGREFMDEYTDKEGNARQSLKVNAYTVGPSLKKATVEVRRVNRATAATAPAAADDPWATTLPGAAEEPPF